MMIMDPESGPPIRCDSTLSVIKIQPATRSKRGNFPSVTPKFSDPEIEELYQLHSTNRKRTELFRCFLYAVLFYCVAQIIVQSFWVANRHHPYDDHHIDMDGHSTFFQSEHPSHTEKELGPHAEHHHHHEAGFSGDRDGKSSGHEVHSSSHRNHSGQHHHHHQHTPEQYLQHFRNSTYKSHPIHPMSGFGGIYNSNQPSPTLNSTQNQPDLHPIYLNNQQLSDSLSSSYDRVSLNDEDSKVLSENQRPDKHPFFRTSRTSHNNNNNNANNINNINNNNLISSIHNHNYNTNNDNSNSNNNNNNNNGSSSSKVNSNKRRRKAVTILEGELERMEMQMKLHSQSHIHSQSQRQSQLQMPLVDWRAQPKSNKVYNDVNDNNVFIVCTFVILAVTAIIILFMLLPIRFCSGNPHIPVLLWSLSILLPIALRCDESMPLRTGLGWVLLETFLIWVTLPIRLRTAFVYSTLLAVSHTGLVMLRGYTQYFMGRQLGANLILLVTTNLLGLLSFYLSDKKQRRAFIDTRQSLEMKLVIEEQAKEQERLLLSVLPEHLALKMRQDLGAAVDGQFKKIYMSRHENVSILYADIVGFTAISSTYSASELVKILNELFARFDRLADKYHQIRIKILGDCYYCICGAPEERPDHGVLCVHMGLSMVKAIKYVRETTNSPVDMRVGIHTGAILAGVLGQRQWQFDIYSKDVELANKMESSGMPGRVHVSEKTLSFLNDEFEVEPGHGEKREEILRIAGIKTYFIVRVNKPLRPSTTSVTENGELQPEDLVTKDFPSELNSTYAEDSNSNVEENPPPRNQSELECYRQRLKEELISRDGYRDLSRQTQWFTLRFQDKSKEAEFLMHKEPYAGITSLACPSALASFSLATFFVISFTFVGLLTATLGLLILFFISAVSACETSPLKSRLKKVSSSLSFLCAIESKLWVRRLLSIFAIILLTATNFVFMIPCFEAGTMCPNITLGHELESHIDPPPPLVLPSLVRPFSSLCLFPAYLIIFCAFFLLSVTLLSQPGSWLKSFAILLVLTLHAVIINVSPLKEAVDCSEKYSFFDGRDLIPESWYFSIFSIVVFLVLFTLNRRLEKSSRVLFLWKTEVEQQRERATQLRQKNEALVYNILPQHVAAHFLGSRRRKHEELYSQSYSEVGILFASMPNFSDFYSEETVNNQGLECLRFLNEVISDFDALLELPRFADNIIKIKTISSTYMAASGLSPLRQAKPEDPLKIRWNHLSLLVEFAFELKRALTSINEQSFNHFVLKMGINHGPITAGVIGARKPHYDIWGNSVNVASRMESTGKAGCIQVTDETYRILLLYGYQFEQRGLVNVKGKGQLMTYYLVGKGPELSDEQVQKLIDEQTALEESQQKSQPLESH